MLSSITLLYLSGGLGAFDHPLMLGAPLSPWLLWHSLSLLFNLSDCSFFFFILDSSFPVMCVILSLQLQFSLNTHDRKQKATVALKRCEGNSLLNEGTPKVGWIGIQYLSVSAS